MNNTITQKITKEDIKNLAKYIEITSDMVIDKLIELNLMVPKTHMVTLFAINEELKFNTHKSKKKRPGDHTNIFKYLLHRLSTDEELAIYHIVFLIKTIEKHANYEKKMATLLIY